MDKSIKNDIGFGTAAIGRPQYINLKTAVDGSSFDLDEFKSKGTEVLNAAYKKGVRHYDTAPGYGIAEELLIPWVNGKKDSQIHISSKWGYRYVANFDPNARVHEIKEHSLAMLNAQWKITKQLLPYLKVYQIHSATLDSGVLENQTVLDRLYEIKSKHHIHIGLSTTGKHQLAVLNKAMTVKINGEQLFQSAQITFNIFEQTMLNAYDQLTTFKGPIIIKEALANGRIFPNIKYAHYSAAYDFLKQLSIKYQVGIDAIALQFCQSCFHKALILSGAKTQAHLRSNLQANQFSLNDSEINKLKTFAIPSNAYWNERRQLEWN